MKTLDDIYKQLIDLKESVFVFKIIVLFELAFIITLLIWKL